MDPFGFRFWKGWDASWLSKTAPVLTKSLSIDFPSTHSVSSLFLHHEDALDTLDNEISWQQISYVRVRGGSVNLKLLPFSCIHVLFAIANKWPQTIMKQNSTIEGRVLPKWTSQYGSLSMMWDSCFYPLPVRPLPSCQMTLWFTSASSRIVRAFTQSNHFLNSLWLQTLAENHRHVSAGPCHVQCKIMSRYIDIMNTFSTTVITYQHITTVY